MKRVAVIGGGIAGLSAAFRLETKRAAGESLDYALFEASDRLGGVIRTEKVPSGKNAGFIIEAGPDSFLSEKPWAAQLCRELGLDDRLLPSNDHQRKTFILLNGRLVELPDGLMFMVPTKLWPLLTTPLFSLGAKLRAASERWSRRHAQPSESNTDESVASFVTRHFGREMVERVAGPLLAGVYGGSADKLSVRAVLPRFAAMEREHGSLIRALMRTRAKAPDATATSIFTTLAGGMQQMTDAIAAQLAPGVVHLNSPVWTLRRLANQWAVVTDAGEQEFDAVILALPAYTAADLLGTVDAPLANELRGIPYNSSITVALAYDAAALDAATRAKIQGFGFLVPESEGTTMLACTFVQNKFSGRVPEGRLLFRCFISAAGAVGETPAHSPLQRSDEEVIATIRAELRQTLGPGLAAEPLFTRVYRWRQAMAQYEVGHMDKVARIDQVVGRLPGLALAGNAYRGIGVPDCVREGTEAADRVLAIQSK